MKERKKEEEEEEEEERKRKEEEITSGPGGDAEREREKKGVSRRIWLVLGWFWAGFEGLEYEMRVLDDYMLFGD